MIRAILTTVVLGVLALGLWAASDLWTATPDMTLEATGERCISRDGNDVNRM